MKVLLKEDFKHSVKLPTPHDMVLIRVWLYENNIKYTYSTYDIGGHASSIKYHFVNERDATLFILKWG